MYTFKCNEILANLIHKLKISKMKKVVLIFVIAINTNLLSAQQTYTQMVDSLLFHIGKLDATTGILYDRVVHFACLMIK